MAVVEARDLKRTYRTTTGIFRRRAMDVEAVRGVSFEIDSGELFGLLGPNGAGKTTTIHVGQHRLLPDVAALRSEHPAQRSARLARADRQAVAAHPRDRGREVARGAMLASVSALVWTEVAVGTAWAAIALTLVWWFEREGRRRASLETF